MPPSCSVVPIYIESPPDINVKDRMKAVFSELVEKAWHPSRLQHCLDLEDISLVQAARQKVLHTRKRNKIMGETDSPDADLLLYNNRDLVRQTHSLRY